jgi:hypothetical protein
MIFQVLLSVWIYDYFENGSVHIHELKHVLIHFCYTL